MLVLREARTVLRSGRGPATTNRYLSATRAVWNLARAAGLVPADTAWPTRLMLTEPRGRVRCLTDAELAAVRNAALNQHPRTRTPKVSNQEKFKEGKPVSVFEPRRR